MAEGTRLQEFTRNTEVGFHEFRESITKMDDRMVELETKVNSMQKSLEEANDKWQGIMMGVEKLQGKGKETEILTVTPVNSRLNKVNNITLTGTPVNSRLNRVNNITPVIVNISKRIEKGSNSGIGNIKRPKVVLAKFNGGRIQGNRLKNARDIFY